MAKPNKAQIVYEVDGVETTLRFHTVITEEHEVHNQLTKFPVQSQFNISNHAIKMNRIVSISGAVTNHQVVGGETFNTFDDSKNVVRLMFSVLQDLVKQAKPCKVTTNFGDYSPVVFTRFKTKLSAGKTDMMEFTMRGEEVQLATTINGNKPTLATFSPLDSTQTEARITELANAGYVVDAEAKLSEATVNMNESFQITSRDDLGNTSITTFEKLASDLTSGNISHLVSTTITDLTDCQDTPLFSDVSPVPSPSLPNSNLTSGGSTVSNCVLEGGVNVVADEIEDSICTVFGDLESSAYGAKYAIAGVNGDQSLGQALLGVGIDCIVIGATGTSAISGSLSDAVNDIVNLPNVQQTINGASSLGSTLANNTNGNTSTVILTKIEGELI